MPGIPDTYTGMHETTDSKTHMYYHFYATFDLFILLNTCKHFTCIHW